MAIVGTIFKWGKNISVEKNNFSSKNRKVLLDAVDHNDIFVELLDNSAPKQLLEFDRYDSSKFTNVDNRR